MQDADQDGFITNEEALDFIKKTKLSMDSLNKVILIRTVTLILVSLFVQHTFPMFAETSLYVVAFICRDVLSQKRYQIA